MAKINGGKRARDKQDKVEDNRGLLEKNKEGAAAALKLFGKYLRPYFRHFVLAVLCLFVASSLGLMFPHYVGKLLDSAFRNHDTRELNATLKFLVGVLAVQAAFSFGRTYLLNYIGENLIFDIRRDFYAHLIRMSLNFYADRRVGELTSRVNSDVNVIQGICTSSVIELIRHVIVAGGGSVVMLATNVKLTGVMLGIVPLLMLAANIFGRYVRQISGRVQDRYADATVVLEETFSGIRTVQSFVRESFEIGRYTDFLGEAKKEALKRALARGGFNAFVVFVMFGGVVVLLWFSANQVMAGRLTTGQLMSFLLYTMVVGGAVGSMSELYGDVQHALGASRRVVALMQTMPEIADAPDAATLKTVEGKVEFRDVTFTYPGREDTLVLKGVSVTARPGDVTALVGPSGGGKSTFVSLIPRFYDVLGGSILIDGHDLRAVKLDDLREHIGIVPQETMLFGGTIRENIAYGNLQASQSEIEDAARAANAHQFVMEFPKGYDTVVGERGVKLSGGQRQRIAIARALLKNPRILILDEATSSLDSESERLVQDALQTLMRGRTTFVIAHRLSTVRQADRILVLDEGVIVEQGNHRELIEQDGLFKKLHDLQFREVRVEHVV